MSPAGRWLAEDLACRDDSESGPVAFATASQYGEPHLLTIAYDAVSGGSPTREAIYGASGYRAYASGAGLWVNSDGSKVFTAGRSGAIGSDYDLTFLRYE